MGQLKVKKFCDDCKMLLLDVIRENSDYEKKWGKVKTWKSYKGKNGGGILLPEMKLDVVQQDDIM